MTIARVACVLLLLIASALGGCGQRGPLTLGAPPSEPPDTLVAEPRADEEQQAEQEDETSGDER